MLFRSVSNSDVDASTVGRGEGEGLRSIIAEAGATPDDLCDTETFNFLPGCFGEAPVLDGCRNEVCNSPRDCSGYVLPFVYTAIRARSAGIVGLNCD